MQESLEVTRKAKYKELYVLHKGELEHRESLQLLLYGNAQEHEVNVVVKTKRGDTDRYS